MAGENEVRVRIFDRRSCDPRHYRNKKHSQSIKMIQYISTRYSPYVKRLAKIKDLRETATVAIIHFKLY